MLAFQSVIGLEIKKKFPVHWHVHYLGHCISLSSHPSKSPVFQPSKSNGTVIGTHFPRVCNCSQMIQMHWWYTYVWKTHEHIHTCRTTKSNTCKIFLPCSHISGSNDSSDTEWCWAKKLQFKDTFSGHSDSCGVPITLKHCILTLMHYILVPA
jgi:hypothetical protein